MNKGIDAAISNEPTMTLEIEQGAAVRIVGNDVTYPDQQTAVVFYSERFIKGRHDVAERFMRAYIRGVRLYNDALKDGRLAGPAADKVIPILTKYTSTKDEAMFRRIIPSAVNPNGEVNLAGLKRDLAFFRELGLIEVKDVSADGVVDGSFVQAAVKQLGPISRRPASSRRSRSHGPRRAGSALSVCGGSPGVAARAARQLAGEVGSERAILIPGSGHECGPLQVGARARSAAASAGSPAAGPPGRGRVRLGRRGCRPPAWPQPPDRARIVERAPCRPSDACCCPAPCHHRCGPSQSALMPGTGPQSKIKSS